MSDNKQTVAPGDGCMVHAGILTSHNGDPQKAVLTKDYRNSATEKFIDEVINELINPNNDPLPCGKPIPPLDPKFAEVFKDLKDEKKFPDFHEKILGYYRDLARSLETGSAYKSLPVCDPIALGAQLFPDAQIKIEKLSDFLKFAIPNPVALASEFAKAGVKDGVIKNATDLDVPLTPVGLSAAIAKAAAEGTIKTTPPPPPKPPATPTQQQLISGGSTVQKPWSGVEAQTLQPYDTIGPDLAAQIGAFGINIATFLPKLIASMPVFVIKMITGGPAEALNTICGLVADSSGLLGSSSDDPNGNPQDIVMRAARKVLARKITEMCVFHALASTVGTSKNGLVGIMAGNTDSTPVGGDDGDSAVYDVASKGTVNKLVEDGTNKKNYVEGNGKVTLSQVIADGLTFTMPPPGTQFNDVDWQLSLQQDLDKPAVDDAPYSPRGADANDDAYGSEEGKNKMSRDFNRVDADVAGELETEAFDALEEYFKKLKDTSQ